MVKVLGDIMVEVGGDVTPLVRAMQRGGRELEGFASKSARMGARVAKVGLAAATALAGVGASTLVMAKQAAAAGVEIDNLARVSGTTTREFQKMAAAAQTVGIPSEKLGDIFKDMQDRVGDFLLTGGGPMADFFETIAPLVGVTADEFARLSGPDALQLYVSSLDKANLTSTQMVAAMEAMASDSTALLPLLRNGGAEFRRLGDEAERAGRILDEEAIGKAKDLDRELTAVADTIKMQFNQAILDNSDDITDLAKSITDDWLPALIQVATALTPVLTRMGEFAGFVARVTNPGSTGSAEYSEEELARRAEDSKVQPGERDPSNTGLYYVDENGNVRSYGEDTPEIPGITVAHPEGRRAPPVPDYPVVPIKETPLGGGGSSDRLDRGDLDDLAGRLATERELIEAEYQERLALIDKFREEEIGKEDEWRELERRASEEHAEALARIDEDRRRARMQSLAGMFGDLSGLMQSENKKLFKIGQAAAIAEATVSGYEAAVEAWSKGMKIGGPPLAAAFTAASLAKTGALISSIGSTSPGGGAGGGGGGAGAASSAGAAPAVAPQQVNLSVGDAEYIPRSVLLSLGERLEALSRDGAIITVN